MLKLFFLSDQLSKSWFECETLDDNSVLMRFLREHLVFLFFFSERILMEVPLIQSEHSEGREEEIDGKEWQREGEKLGKFSG